MATAAAIDLLFLATPVHRHRARNRGWANLRNLKVLVLVGLLFGGNALFHAEAILMHGGSGYGARIGIGAAVLLITLIGGRIVPSFTRNWLVRERRGACRRPSPLSMRPPRCRRPGDRLLGRLSASDAVTAVLAAVAGLLHAMRLGRWAGYRTVGEPLVLVLHVAYAFVPDRLSCCWPWQLSRRDLVVATGRCMHGQLVPSAR